jgi:hypothetical protein
MALVMAIGITTVLGIVGTTALAYSTSDAQQSNQSRSRQSAFSLAESGINNLMSILNLPTNNALDPETLPKCTTNEKKYTDPAATRTSTSTWLHGTFAGGSVDYCGTLVRSSALWYVTSLGSAQNPNRGGGMVTRTLEATVTVTPLLTQPLNNPVWDYLYAGHTGSTCDQTLNNNISGSSRMYVAGNLCLSPNVVLTQSQVIVGGNLDIANNAAVGASTSMSTRVETYVGGNCRYGGVTWVACSGNQDANHIYSYVKQADGTTPVGVNHTAPVIAPPVADFGSWYENAIPGPSQTCTTSSGSPPTFDTNYPSRDNSVTSAVDLTPSSSYFCRVGPGASTTLANAMTSAQTTLTVASATGFPTSAFTLRIDDEYMAVTGGFGTTTWTVTRGVNGSTAAAHVTAQTAEWKTPTSGEIAWNATTKTLTIAGTIFIDGSAKISNGAVNTYNGYGTLYLSGTFRVTGSLCAAVSGSDCNFAGWNPDADLLMIVANGSGGQVNGGDSIQVDNNYSWQGGLYGTNAVEFGNNVNVDGPIVGSQILLSNNLTTNAFPNITVVPVGMPSNQNVYAQPNPPQNFSG